MWANDENCFLIRMIEDQVLREIPIISTNNNHEFTGNLLDIARDWDQIANNLNRSVIECKRQWRELIRQFLFATNRVNIDDDDGNRSPPVYTISWRYVEQMMFLVPYAGKYERRDEPDENKENKENEDPIETPDTETNIEPKRNSRDYEFGTMTPQRLKDYIKEQLKTKAVQMKAQELLVYLRKFCHNQPYLNKFTYMIQLNMEGWRHNDKLKFVQWYSKQLERIISKQS